MFSYILTEKQPRKWKIVKSMIIPVLICLTLLIQPAACASEVGPMIHYSERTVELNQKLALEQGYTIHIQDINPENGDVWLEVLLDDTEIEDGQGTAKKENPFEYVHTIEEEDEDEEDHLIFMITPLDEDSPSAYSKIRIEQYLDPSLDEDYLVLDTSLSVEHDTALELEGGYSLSATDIKDGNATLTLSKNGYEIKTQKDMGIGDYFTYYRTDGNRVMTVFIAKLHNIFQGADSRVVLLKEVTRSRNIEVKSNIGINVESVDGSTLKSGDRAIITYQMDTGISEVMIYLDSEKIDSRRDVEKGEYTTLTEDLDAGEHEVRVTTVAEDGTGNMQSTTFTVSAQDIDEEETKDQTPASEEGEVEEDGPLTDGLDSIGSIPGFNYLLAGSILLIMAFLLKKEFM